MSLNPTYEQLFAKARSQKGSDGDNSLYFKDPTSGQLASSSEFEPTAFGLPGAASALLQKTFKRAGAIGKTYASQSPGLSTADKEMSKDPLNEHLTNLMISGGTVIPLAALAARTLNAGPINAGTLVEAKRLGYYKE